MLAHLLAMLDNPPPAEPVLTARGLEHYMLDHLADPASLSAVADHFGLSPCYLSRRAKTLLGDTLIRTWERLKIRWARTLLREPSFTVAQVARRVGYEDAFYFSKVFKAHTGRSPRAWRRSP
jgi:AraC-like DNA-binding protein